MLIQCDGHIKSLMDHATTGMTNYIQIQMHIHIIHTHACTHTHTNTFDLHGIYDALFIVRVTLNVINVAATQSTTRNFLIFNVVHNILLSKAVNNTLYFNAVNTLFFNSANTLFQYLNEPFTTRPLRCWMCMRVCQRCSYMVRAYLTKIKQQAKSFQHTSAEENKLTSI